jgi:hypothetical protein
MHHHLNEERQDSVRPKGSRIETDREAHPGRAVLTDAGMCWTRMPFWACNAQWAMVP